MAITGRKPKDEKVTRHPLTHDWVDVPDVPFRGCECPEPGGPGCGGAHIPKCPSRRIATKQWWTGVTAMPHCVLWSPMDWQYALDTARIHAAFAGGDFARAAELRIRERIMGTTVEARRDLRIRYVSAVAIATDVEQPPADIGAERRRRLLNAE